MTRLFQAGGWLCLAAIGALSLVTPSMRPVTFLPHSFEHVAIFLAAGLAIGLGYPNRAAQHAIALTLFAAAIELAQFYAPGRHPRLSDFVVDALAACAGVVVALILSQLKRAS
ncbi:MAG TPA: VanZ family protein [Xanthobacteraceae bacterium]|nr:VanZ family protein [Xanthobacteraceae bacterium]